MKNPGQLFVAPERMDERMCVRASDFAALQQAAEALYFAGYWHCDRPADEQALWTALRDAAGIQPGQTGARLGPDRTPPEVASIRPGLEAVQSFLAGAYQSSNQAAVVLDCLEAYINNELAASLPQKDEPK